MPLPSAAAAHGKIPGLTSVSPRASSIDPNGAQVSKTCAGEDAKDTRRLDPCAPAAHRLLRVFHHAGFADDGDADLAGILKFVLDLADDVLGEGESGFVGDLVR